MRRREQYRVARSVALYSSGWRRCSGVLPYYGRLRLAAVSGDVDCVDTDAVNNAYRPASLGIAYDAVEPAVTVDCH